MIQALIAKLHDAVLLRDAALEVCIHLDGKAEEADRKALVARVTWQEACQTIEDLRAAIDAGGLIEAVGA